MLLVSESFARGLAVARAVRPGEGVEAFPFARFGFKIDASVGSVGDSDDNGLAESIFGLFRTEVINFLVPWKSVSQVERETLKWVNWYNLESLHSAIGYATPQEAEEVFYENLNANEKAA